MTIGQLTLPNACDTCIYDDGLTGCTCTPIAVEFNGLEIVCLDYKEPEETKDDRQIEK